MNRFAKMFLFSVVAVAAFGLIATDDAEAGCYYGGFGYGGYGGWYATPYYNTSFYAPTWNCYRPYYGYRTCNYGAFNYYRGWGCGW